jgi:serine/threonine protein kinase
LDDSYNFDSTLDARMEGSSNSAVSFVRECLRLDPKKRPTAQELLDHDFFLDFKEWFEDEMQVLAHYDEQ